MKIPFLLLLLFCLETFPLHAQWKKAGNHYGPTEMLKVINNELYATAPCYYTCIGCWVCNIVKWDGNTWTPVVSTYTLGGAYAKDVLWHNNELYVGGGFSMIGRWNGSNWTYLGSGINGYYVKDIVVFNGEIYAAGSFNQIGGVYTRGVAKWNGTNWSAVGGGLSGGFPTSEGQALLYKNDLYVGGDFTMAGNVPAICIARWNGTKWDSVGSGTNGEVLDFVVDTANDFLYVGGRMSYGNARWNGYTWTTLDSGISGNIYSLAIYHHQLYAVGYFIAVGGEGVARWNGAYWEAVGGGTTPGGNTVESCEVYKDELYVGGGFTDAGGDTSIKWIARWYSPPDTTCKFILQPIIESMLSLTAPNGVADTFYFTDSVAVQFYNNIASSTSWQWDFGDGKTGAGKTPVHYYNTAGTYTVSVIVNYPYGPKGPCIDTAYKTITVIYGIQGIHEIKTSISDFKVFPNPAREEITIQLKDVSSGKPAALTIRNSSGQEVLKQSLKKEITLNTSKWEKGLYLIEVCSQSDRCKTEKVVIE